MVREGKSKGKVIIPKSTREITILFYQKLNGAWMTFSEYPRSELETKDQLHTIAQRMTI